MPKCDFNKVAYWNHLSAWVFSWKLAAYFQNTFFFRIVLKDWFWSLTVFPKNLHHTCLTVSMVQIFLESASFYCKSIFSKVHLLNCALVFLLLDITSSVSSAGYNIHQQFVSFFITLVPNLEKVMVVSHFLVQWQWIKKSLKEFSFLSNPENCYNYFI